MIRHNYDNCFVIEQEDEIYPQALYDLPRPPKRIYLKGNPDVLKGECISVIGARKSTPYGEAASELSGRIAADCGLVVVSGGARGCDYTAGMAAINSGGISIVVAGCGADRIYPASSQRLYDAVVRQGGAIISLETWNTAPARHTFPKRNHIIAALSKALVITEAGLPSGTFQTATVAAQLGRNILCIPGSIFSPNSRGTNALIEDGAAIVPDAEALEILISLIYQRSRIVLEGNDTMHDQILTALIANPMRAEELARILRIDLLSVVRSLADYEATGMVIRLADGRYSPVKTLLLERDDKRRDLRMQTRAERNAYLRWKDR